MILIDAIYINNGGGKILLNYLVKKLEARTANVFYLFDKRCENDFEEIPFNRKVYMDSSLLKRHQFYKENKNNFSEVLCFGNLAPTIKLDVPVYTYFHQPMYLHIPDEFGLKRKVIFQIKTFLFEKLLKNTSKLIVQHQLMKNESIKKFKLNNNNIHCIPFYPNEDLSYSSNNRERNTFIYVSNATPHKNHLRLIEAFVRFYDKYKTGKLVVTIHQHFTELYDLIVHLNKKEYPIINIGFVGREELIKNYHQAEYLIFPSLEESFGLGIVEAIECGCKVIGADLPYMHQVCEPSIKFNSKDIDSIYESFEDALNKKEQPTIKKINNKIEQLLDLLNS